MNKLWEECKKYCRSVFVVHAGMVAWRGRMARGAVEAASLCWMLKQKDRERQCQVSGGEKKWRYDSDERGDKKKDINE